MYKLNARQIAEKIQEVADVEVQTLMDIHSVQPENQLAQAVHRFLGKVVLSEVVELRSKGENSAQIAMEEMKKVLIESINRLTSILLRRASRGSKTALGANVTYEVEFDVGAPSAGIFVYDVDDSDFMWFPTVLDGAIRLRGGSISHQRIAVKLGRSISDRKDLVRFPGNTSDSEREQELKTISDAIDFMDLHLPKAFVGTVHDFEFLMSLLGNNCSSIPRLLSLEETPIELRELADIYGQFASALRFYLLDSAKGTPAQRRTATMGWGQFHSAGQALRVVGCWMRALSIQEEEKLCPICYRHAAARVRCIEHATHTGETQNGRLGKRIRPHYLLGLDALFASRNINMVFRQSVRPREDNDESLEEAARKFGLSSTFRSRAVSLAKQLRKYYPLLNGEQTRQMEELFKIILESTLSVPAYESARTVAERRTREMALDTALERVSAKGFFKAWFGDAWPAWRDQGVGPGLRYDRRHPVNLGGPLDLEDIPRQLVMQRSWSEAEKAFVDDVMPSAELIESLHDQGLNYDDVGEKLGYTRQTLWSRRKRPERLRNRLRK